MSKLAFPLRVGLCRLRDRSGLVQEEQCDLLKRVHADVHGPVYTIGRLFPTRLAGCHRQVIRGAISILYCQLAASDDDREAVIGVDVPGRAFPRFENLPAREPGSLLAYFFVDHATTNISCRSRRLRSPCLRAWRTSPALLWSRKARVVSIPSGAGSTPHRSPRR